MEILEFELCDHFFYRVRRFSLPPPPATVNRLPTAVGGSNILGLKLGLVIFGTYE